MRTGRTMSRLTNAQEEPVLAAPLRNTAVTAAVLALTAVAFHRADPHGVTGSVYGMPSAHIGHRSAGQARLGTVLAG